MVDSSSPSGDSGPTPSRPLRVLELAWAFLRLGCLSFGGPIAHLGYFRAEFVDKRKWLDDAHYADLVALCQFLPGPASSQVAFALGMQRGGLFGALAASVGFTLPSALLMIGFAYGLGRAGDLQNAGWLHGLKLAAVAVVTQAVWGMGKKLCPDRPRLSLCLASAALLLAVPGALPQLGVIAAAGAVGLFVYRNTATAPSVTTTPEPNRHLGAATALGLFAVLLAGLPAAAAALKTPLLSWFDAFYRSGALIFGGGHVMLPLLRAEVVPPGWLSDDQFLAGYGAAQALPGPMSAFSAYLGTAMSSAPNRWLGGLWCLVAIFLPALLLIGGALPFWHRLRSKRWTQAALAGANASVVGVLLAALYDPVIVQGVRGPRDAVGALVAFGLLELWKAPPWLVVLGLAAAGHLGVLG